MSEFNCFELVQSNYHPDVFKNNSFFAVYGALPASKVSMLERSADFDVSLSYAKQAVEEDGSCRVFLLDEDTGNLYRVQAQIQTVECDHPCCSNTAIQKKRVVNRNNTVTFCSPECVKDAARIATLLHGNREERAAAIAELKAMENRKSAFNDYLQRKRSIAPKVVIPVEGA